MDILYELSYLLFQDATNRDDKSPEYKDLCHLESVLLEDLTQKAGSELVEKLEDVQGELEPKKLYYAFLHGLRLGIALSFPYSLNP